MGWATSANGELAFFDGDEIIINFHNDLVLFAVWRAREASYWWLWLLIILIVLLLLMVLTIYLIRRHRKKKLKYMSKQ